MGLRQQFVEIVYPLFEGHYQISSRVKATSVTNVPTTARRSSSQPCRRAVAWDAAMMSVTIRKHHALPRQPRAIVLDSAFRLPWVSVCMRRAGGLVASPYNAMRLLEQDHLVIAFPEGVKGAAEPSRAAAARALRTGRLRRGRAAHRAPIVPVAVVGSRRSPPRSPTRGSPPACSAPSSRSRLPFRCWAPPAPFRCRRAGGSVLDPVDLSEYPPEAARPCPLLELSDRVRDTIQELLDFVERGFGLLSQNRRLGLPCRLAAPPYCCRAPVAEGCWRVLFFT